MIFDCVFLHRDVLETVTSLASLRRPPSRALRSAFPPCHPSLPSRTALGVFPNGGTARLAADHGRTGAPGSRGGVLLACRWRRTSRRSWATTVEAAMEMGMCLVGAACRRRIRTCLARRLPLRLAGCRLARSSSSRTRGYTMIEKLESSFCLSLVHFTDMKIEKGEIYEENLISHSCWMDLVWYWPDFTMCLLKALEYILYVKDCNNF